MKQRALVVLLIAACGVSADIEEQGPPSAAPSGLLAGLARADITPPVGIPHMNWGSATHIAAEGVDPVGMKATALVLSDGKQKFVMVDIDALSTAGYEPAIAQAAQRTGIPAAHIRLGASHTHAGANISAVRGPLGADLTEPRKMMERYRAEVIDKLAGAIVEANSKLRPVHLYAGRGTGSINVNRRFRAQGGFQPAVGRNAEGFVDRDLLVIRIDDADGKPYAVVVNYQCHGTVLAYENRKVSPDWIGMTRRTVEQAFPGALCLYFQGAAGNQGPMEGFTGDLRVAHRLGATLGHQAAAVTLGVETVRREPSFEGYVESTALQARQPWRVQGPRDSTLRFVSRVIEVPRRTYSAQEIASMEARVVDAKAKLEAAGPSDAWQRHMAGARLRRLSNLLEVYKRPPDPSPVKVEVQLLRIGSVAILSMPGEPFGEIGAALRKASPFDFTLFCAYSSGAGGGYMPTRAEFAYGGYEIEQTEYGEAAAETLISEASKLFAEVR